MSVPVAKGLRPRSGVAEVYAVLWRVLPGPWWARALVLVALLAGVVYVCFTWVFPALAPLVPVNDNTVGAGLRRWSA